MGFDFSIVYKLGKDNRVADALSRSINDSEEEEILFTNKSEGVSGSFLALSAPINNIIIELKQEISSTPELHLIQKKIESDEAGMEGFSIRNGFIFFKGRYFISQTSKLIPKLLNEFHNSTLGGHFWD